MIRALVRMMAILAASETGASLIQALTFVVTEAVQRAASVMLEIITMVLLLLEGVDLEVDGINFHNYGVALSGGGRVCSNEWLRARR